MPWSLINLAVTFLAFGFLARISPCNPEQRAFVSRDLADNTLYWFLGVLTFGGLADLYIHTGVGLALGTRAAAAVLSGYGVAARLPLALQAVLVIVVMDFIQY